MRTDDGERVGYEFPIEIRRLVEDPVSVQRFHCGGHITGHDNTVNFRMELVDFIKKLHAGKTWHVEIGNDDCRADVVDDDLLKGFARVLIDSNVSKTG